eukprot:scaffold40201_cov27-Tisochrysis_lutea.AAC.2
MNQSSPCSWVDNLLPCGANAPQELSGAPDSYRGEIFSRSPTARRRCSTASEQVEAMRAGGTRIVEIKPPEKRGPEGPPLLETREGGEEKERGERGKGRGGGLSRSAAASSSSLSRATILTPHNSAVTPSLVGQGPSSMGARGRGGNCAAQARHEAQAPPL